MKSFVLVALLAAFAAATPATNPRLCTKICLFNEPDCGENGVATNSGDCWFCCTK